MIWYYLLIAWNNVIVSFFGLFGLNPVTELPFGMDSYLSIVMGYLRSFFIIFPPASDLFVAVMIYLGFKVIMWSLRLFRIIR